MLKPINFMLALLCSAPCLTAQTTLDRRHLPQAGDVIEKQRVAFVDPGAGGRDMVWDFSSLRPEGLFPAEYLPSDKTDGSFCEKTRHNRFYYATRGDTLVSLGFENNTMRMDYTAAEPLLRYPTRYGDTISGAFSGTGEYAHRYPLSVSGETETVADAFGRLILPDVTIESALRVRTTRAYDRICGDTSRIVIDRYIWYCAEARYPVFESVRGGVLSKTSADTVFHSTSFYFPPKAQRAQIDLDEDIYGDSETSAGTYGVIISADVHPNPVTDILNVRWTMSDEATVWLSLHGGGGMTFLSTSPSRLQAGDHTESLNVGHLIPGTYTVHIHADGYVTAVTVIKR